MPSGVYKRNAGTLEDFFWERVEKEQPNGCWIWKGAEKHSWYGDCRKEYAHRVSWKLHNNLAIPRDMHICHKCDNTKCVNPSHLYLGTPKDNNADVANRSRYKTGSKSSKAKITSSKVKELRKEAETLLKKMSRQKAAILLSPKYGLTHFAIRDIIAGKRWNHLL